MVKNAKDAEIQQWLKNKVVAALPKNCDVSRALAMKMRRVLTWKHDKEGRRAKARLVVLGFQGPALGETEVAAPVMQKRSRGLFIQNAVNKAWRIYKADVKNERSYKERDCRQIRGGASYQPRS